VTYLVWNFTRNIFDSYNFSSRSHGSRDIRKKLILGHSGRHSAVSTGGGGGGFYSLMNTIIYVELNSSNCRFYWTLSVKDVLEIKCMWLFFFLLHDILRSRYPQKRSTDRKFFYKNRPRRTSFFFLFLRISYFETLRWMSSYVQPVKNETSWYTRNWIMKRLSLRYSLFDYNGSQPPPSFFFNLT